MGLVSAIQYVGSGLALVAFFISAITLSYQRNLKEKERRILSIPKEDRIKAALAAAEYIHINIDEIPENQRVTVVLEQLRIKAQRQLQFFYLLL